MNTVHGGGYLRYAFTTIVRGFLLGIGISLAVGATLLIGYEITIRHTEDVSVSHSGERVQHFEPPPEDFPGHGQPSAKDFELKGLEELKHDGVTSIIGSITNKGNVKARSVKIEADLFQHGKFVDQYETYLSGSLAPGESRNFKIACGCNAPPAAHDSYKVEVIP